MQVPPGHAILFCGYTMHTGVPITAGTRYVLTGFVGGRPLSFTPALASLVRYVLTGFVDFRAAVEAVRPFYGPIPGALVTPPWHAECSAQRPHPSLHTGPSQARHPLPNCMLSASLSSQARCPHSVWSGQRACTCSSRRPHPTPLFTGTLPTPFGAGSNDFPSPHLGMNRERLCRAYGGVRGEPDCL
jgi:hypothetical protein